MDKPRAHTLRRQLLVFITAATTMPLFFLTVFSSYTMLNYLSSEKKDFYLELVSQVADSFDTEFNRQAMNLSTIAVMDFFTNTNAANSSIEQTAMSQVNGQVVLVELDRKSPGEKQDHAIHHFTYSATYDIDIDRLLTEPMMRELYSDPELTINFSTIQKGSIKAPDIENRGVIIFPCCENPGQSFTRFLLVLTDANFIPGFYSDIENLNSGTMYVLDRYNQKITASHPGPKDDYTFNPVTGSYQDDIGLGNNHGGMNLRQYNMLNTDPAILNVKQVRDIITKLDTPDYQKLFHDEFIGDTYSEIIPFKNRQYLAIFKKTSASACKFIYFHPMSAIVAPVKGVVIVMVIVALVMITLVSFISLFIGSSITNPLKQMANAARNIQQGDYKTQVTITSRNELYELAQCFNTMAREIENKTNSLEELNVKLKRLDKIKSMFLHTISDQLRTPLNLITGFNEILARERHTILLNTADTASDLLETMPVDDKYKPSRDFLNWFINDVVDEDKTFFELFTKRIKELTAEYPEDIRNEVEEQLSELGQLNLTSEETLEDAYRVIRNNVKCLESIISSASDISRINAATSLVRREMVWFKGLTTFLEKDVERIIEQYNKKNELKFSINVTDGVPEHVLLDEVKIRTVLQNLLSNAIKYTDNGSIDFTITYQKNSVDTDFITFSISDTGRGIKEEDFDIIFTEFAKPDYTTQVDGAGVGLALCKKIIELMNGTITLESEFGKGSTFSVVLPVM
jgi:signal transduction histidine kinase